MLTESQSEKPKLENSVETARELKILIERTGVVNQIRNELFNEWLNSEPMIWPQIKAKLALLSTGELLLNRMATPDE